ncbi:MAG TPA: hypothetical protein VI759_01460 [Dehalococcoidia bacterium]|nr:hypothetical protein [Dehalococcoidia bacterium]
MALQTWVARFVVDHGKVTEEGGRLRTFERRRLDEPDVDLHIICEPEGVKGEELGAQALDAIGRLFLQDRLSITGGLLRALQSTHQTLLDWNRRSVPREQVRSGLTAAVVSGSLVYLAQAGPSLAYLRRDGVLKRLDVDEIIAPLGEGELEPALRRFELQPGDVLIGASTSLTTILDDATLDAMLTRGSDEALPELYLLTRDLESFALFAITCTDSGDDEAEAPATEESAFAREPVLPEEPEEAAPTFVVETPPGAEGPPQPVLVAPTPFDISKPVVRLRGEQSIARGEYARTTGPAGGLKINFADKRLLQIVGVALLALLIFAFVPGLIQQNKGEKLDDLMASADQQYAIASNATDPAVKRKALEETRRLAQEARRIDPLNASANDLLQQATTQLTVMDAILDLSPLATVTTLGRQLTGEVSIESVLVDSARAYMLDTKGGRLIAVALGATGPPAVLYQDGQSYEGTPAKKPIAFARDQIEGQNRLLILDEERKLFEIRGASSPKPIPLRRTNTWASVAGIATYDGNLYVLDPQANQVHRYLPAATGFDSEPSDILASQQNLKDAQGLAVDGDVFVFFKDGAVHRYKAGSDAGFTFGGIDRLPKALIDMALVPAAQEVYLADSGNKRIIVAGEDGIFRRQLVSSAFTDLRAIAVDPNATQIYVVVGDALLTAPLVR